MKRESKPADYYTSGWVFTILWIMSVPNFLGNNTFPRLKWLVLCAGLFSFVMAGLMFLKGYRKSNLEGPQDPGVKPPSKPS